jgi:peptide/nickel transport system ATP-binding protein
LSPARSGARASAVERGSGTLVVRDLAVSVDGRDDPVVSGISFEVTPAGALGIVGESGSGKSLTCRSVLGILPEGVHLTRGSIEFDGIDLTALDYDAWRELRGTRISAVFQDPASYLNPSIRVGRQLAEVLRVKLGHDRRAAKARAIELLESVGLHEPALVYEQFPYQLSGGMLQRVLIAIAISGEPELLIADEATTALDVTVQAEVLDLLEDLRRERNLALILVSHDLAVVAQLCENVIVMKDGAIVEAGPAAEVLGNPQHEYTRLLIDNHNAYGIERFIDQEVPSA